MKASYANSTRLLLFVPNSSFFWVRVGKSIMQTQQTFSQYVVIVQAQTRIKNGSVQLMLPAIMCIKSLISCGRCQSLVTFKLPFNYFKVDMQCDQITM